MRRPRTLLVTLLAILLSVSQTACDSLSDPASRGQRAMEAGDFDRALAAYSLAIERGSDNPIVFANRCIANDASGHFEQAVGDCTTAMEMYEALGEELEGYSAHEVLNNRGVSYLNLRELDDAMADFEAAIELEPDYAEAYANRGRIHLDREDYDLAIEDLDRAIELNPDLTEAYGNRGLAYQYQGDDVQALADFTQAIEINNSPMGYYNRAALQYTLGRFDEAYDDYKSVLEHGDPGSFIFYASETQSNFLENRPGSGNAADEATDDGGAEEEGVDEEEALDGDVEDGDTGEDGIDAGTDGEETDGDEDGAEGANNG